MDSKWINFLQKISDDKRLNVWHIAIIVAIIQIAIAQDDKNRIRISRSKLMKKSHIKTIPTYHKYFKELQLLGYTRYTPSYHPKGMSYVEIFY
ncbi:hypothetical protein NAL32_03840 [Chryseobacterium sp. Ch-15]|uniref:Uncharacterized protein n=1 Tax=Chryseobacterium muglaense TaxID=2893752 RepID=A0A9Q3UTX7_9FLAO|nr:hypothetical protein [Chryseobacterium muglaense]MBD3903870.1 hypothetical protein [Chryseobacterium muglaense]MCC9032945.1 hypothetical protein [Chryseobacterium muglaense]MCM2553518.1 hypothetical protein [Chryseobacterium muglaense]